MDATRIRKEKLSRQNNNKNTMIRNINILPLSLKFAYMNCFNADRSIEILTKEYKERVQVLKSELQQFHDNVSSMLKRKKKQFKMEQRLLAEQKVRWHIKKIH